MKTTETEFRFSKSRARMYAATMALVAACAMLSGCALLSAGGERAQSTLYAPDPRVAPDPSWPSVSWQLSLSQPTAARMIDTFRIAVRPTPDEVQVYKGAAWAKLPSDMVEDTIIRALEDSGRIAAVARQGTGIAADYKLVLDMRRFEADYAGNALPSATIEINAKLLRSKDQSVIGAQTFRHAEPAAGKEVAQVVEAFSRSLERVGGDIARWTLQTGNAAASGTTGGQ